MSLRRAIVLCLVVLAPVSLRAAPRDGDAGTPGVSAQLDDADRRYADLDYRGAAERAELAARDERASREEQVRAWERVGLSWLVLNQRSLAREALGQMFTLDPTHAVEDPSLSPRQREFIEEIHKEHPVPEPQKPTLDLAPVAPLHPPPPLAPSRPVWKRWYLWTPLVLGLVGVGVGVGLGLGLSNRGPTGTLPPGTASLALHF